MEISFGEKIRILREKKKLTLKDVASTIGIDTSMLGKIEKGTRKANPTILKHLSSIYKISEKELNISMLSDQIANQVVKKFNDQAFEILKIAEKKVVYKKSK